MSRKRERREGYATAKGFCDVTIREVEEFLNGKSVLLCRNSCK